jgi:hypothetical protein
MLFLNGHLNIIGFIGFGFICIGLGGAIENTVAEYRK